MIGISAYSVSGLIAKALARHACVRLQVTSNRRRPCVQARLTKSVAPWPEAQLGIVAQLQSQFGCSAGSAHAPCKTAEVPSTSPATCCCPTIDRKRRGLPGSVSNNEVNGEGAPYVINRARA